MQNTPTFRSSQKPPACSIRRWPWYVLIFLCVLLMRVVYVSLFAASVPFWDQWDELDLQVLPWLQGSWHVLQLFQPHLEHRVAISRIVTMFLLAANGRVFDNLVEAYANTFIYAGLWTVMFALLIHNDSSRLRRWALLLAIAALGALPFDWENTLVGFQSSFHLMELAAVAVIGMATYCKPTSITAIGLAFVASVSLFTMAPGLLAAPVVILVLGYRTWQDALPHKFIIPAIVVMLAITLIGLLLLCAAPSPPGYEAIGFFEHSRAMLMALMWPLQPFDARFHVLYVLLAVVTWAPVAIWIWQFARTRRTETSEIFAAGICGWVLLEFMAMAHARGHYMGGLPSRYMEIPALGLAANFWLALKLASRLDASRFFLASASIIVGVVLLGWTFWVRFPADLAAMVQRSKFSGIETLNVRHYLGGGSMPTLPPNSLELPYPSKDRLQHLLDLPQMRALVPPTLLPPPESDKSAPLSTLATNTQRLVQHGAAWAKTKIGPDIMDTPAQVVSALSGGFSAFTEAIPNHPTNTQCALDRINGQPAGSAGPLARETMALFQGWAGDGHGQALKRPILVLKSDWQTYAAPLTAGGKRPDVALALKSEEMTESGYNQSLPLNHLASGVYSSFVTEDANPSVTCNLRQTLTVR